MNKSLFSYFSRIFKKKKKRKKIVNIFVGKNFIMGGFAIFLVYIDGGENTGYVGIFSMVFEVFL
jgi:hypothetical protein